MSCTAETQKVFEDMQKGAPFPNKIIIGLSQEKAKELFEAHFGKDKDSRTKSQWRALVKQYGYLTVMKQDKMTKKEIKNRCKNG